MTGLVGWWPLHEQDGSTARDLSGSGNHGTVNGSVTQGVAGKGGLTAYSFDGTSDDYIDTGSIPTLKSLTVTLWVKINELTGSWNYILANHKSGTAGFGVSNSPEDKWRINLRDSEGGNYAVTPSEQAETDTWTFLAGTYDEASGLLKLYQNGSLVGSRASGRNTTTDPLIIGAPKAGSGQFPGQALDIRVYNRALTPQEIQTLYEWGSGDYTDRSYHDGSDPGAVSRWKFDGDVKDSWGLNDGNRNGASFTTDSARNEALNFNGSGDYVFTESTDQQAYSASCWVKADSISDNSMILMRGRAVEENLQLYTSSAVDAWRTYVRDINDNNYSVNSEKSHVTGAWNHLATTWDGRYLKLYVNGVEEGKTDSDGVTLTEPGLGMNIGSRFDNDGVSRELYFDGKIDDVRIYDRALEPHEVFQLYQWGTRGRDMRKLTVNQR